MSASLFIEGQLEALIANAETLAGFQNSGGVLVPTHLNRQTGVAWAIAQDLRRIAESIRKTVEAEERAQDEAVEMARDEARALRRKLGRRVELADCV
jgi:hypothetical protein